MGFFSRVHHDAHVVYLARIWHGRQVPAPWELWPFVPWVFPSQKGDDTRPAGSAAKRGARQTGGGRLTNRSLSPVLDFKEYHLR